MTVLISACAFVGVLCLVDLLLTLGVIRRLREHTAIFARIPQLQPDLAESGVTTLADGEAPQGFRATTSDGMEVTGPGGLRVVAFFSTTCPMCRERAPAFIDYLRARVVGRDDVLVVVAGEADEPPSYLSALAELAHVCMEAHGGPVGRAFAVQGYPGFFLLDPAGIVVTSCYDPTVLPTPATV